jgi:hypothetical protein
MCVKKVGAEHYYKWDYGLHHLEKMHWKFGISLIPDECCPLPIKLVSLNGM